MVYDNADTFYSAKDDYKKMQLQLRKVRGLGVIMRTLEPVVDVVAAVAFHIPHAIGKAGFLALAWMYRKVTSATRYAGYSVIAALYSLKLRLTSKKED